MEENNSEEKEHQNGNEEIMLQGRMMRIRAYNKEEFIAEMSEWPQGDW